MTALTRILACACLLTTPALAQEAPPKPDLLSFAQGALPVGLGGAAEALRVDMGQAVAVIDGAPGAFVLTRKPATAADQVEITFALPALTRFDRLAVPGIRETPSPSQTFFREVTVLGSDHSVDGPYVLLAEGTLATPDSADAVTELTLAPDAPEVAWVRIVLQGGIDVQTDKSFLEFSELIGEGIQRTPPLSNRFAGVWRGRGVKLELAQDGATVTGCYDGLSKLDGTVQGNVLRALGTDAAGIASQFILIAAPGGAVRGLRSSNGAPFKPYDGDPSDAAPTCLAPEPPHLGCGSVVHGIGFDYDSAVLQPASHTIIADLFAGLSTDSAERIEIIGHSSSEGAEAYNLDLSQRRAQSVVAALVEMGVPPARIAAAGKGEAEPIASNADAAGRAMNRRVEVRCAS
ncbi:MAG: OmpA family protein [Pseudomonadota bacterium]